MCYSQLGDVGQLSAVTLNQIDSLCDLLPINIRKEWMRQYRLLPSDEKIHPFSPFMAFLEDERDDSMRLSERTVSKKIDLPKNSDKTKSTKAYH